MSGIKLFQKKNIKKTKDNCLVCGSKKIKLFLSKEIKFFVL